ncbi:MAG: hypothetical protein R3F34_08295 [Planctomycetota bacterium]
MLADDSRRERAAEQRAPVGECVAQPSMPRASCERTVPGERPSVCAIVVGSKS